MFYMEQVLQRVTSYFIASNEQRVKPQQVMTKFTVKWRATLKWAISATSNEWFYKEKQAISNELRVKNFAILLSFVWCDR